MKYSGEFRKITINDFPEAGKARRERWAKVWEMYRQARKDFPDMSKRKVQLAVCKTVGISEVTVRAIIKHYEERENIV